MTELTQHVSTDSADEMDFLTLLEESLSIEQPTRGDIAVGTILAIDSLGMVVDLGMKRDGIIPRSDIERLGETSYQVGDEIPVMIVRTEDDEGNMIVSATKAKQNEDWIRAEEMMGSEEIYTGTVADANRGGLILPYGELRGFIPASHVVDLARGLNEDERKENLSSMIGQQISVKIIEVNRRRRRLVLSQREAQREIRDARKDNLLESLEEGEVRKGVVSGLRDFGAFVDLGGADGLIHISELAWHRVKHPRELLTVGQEVEVYVLRLDHEGRRIGLSLKRLQPNPWTQVDDMYHVGQVIEGTISRVTQFGAFVSMEPGIEALLHASQISDPAPADPAELLQEGQVIQARVISIESHRQRLGLSIRDVDNGDLLDTEVETDDETDVETDVDTDEPHAEIEASEDVDEQVELSSVEPGVEDEPIVTH